MDKPIRPVFTLELNYKIVPGLISVGKYDGTHPCLTAATTADKVVIHSPHRRSAVTTGRVIWSESNREIATLNINQTITALTAGVLLPNEEKDILIVGTSTHILAYHVHDNKDVFYKECADGVNAIVLGTFRNHKTPLILIGGNSSVHGFDHEGNEVFWTAIGDVVTSLILMDYNKDGLNELIVSSEDFNIRVYKGDQIIAEHTETEVVTGLLSLSESRFAYSISNGTIGVYIQDVRLWRVKSKNFAISTWCYDLLGKGVPQLITGWSNGKIDCRAIQSGEVLFKDLMPHGVAGIVEGDYRSIGKTDLICVSIEGEVRGYTTTKALASTQGTETEQDLNRELLAQKQSLLQELKHYENNAKYNEDLTKVDDSLSGVGIPANTRLQIEISANSDTEKCYVEVFIATNNNTVIKAVIVFAEGIFKGETHVVHPSTAKLSNALSVPLRPPKDNPVDIHMKILVGYSGSAQFHVFEITRQLPRFSMYALLETNQAKTKPESFVEFRINERLQRICMWVNQNFLLPRDVEFENEPDLRLDVKCLRDGSSLVMIFETSGRVTVCTDNLALASDLVQSLCAFLNLDALEVLHCDFDKKFIASENSSVIPKKRLLKDLKKIEASRVSFGEEEEKLRSLMTKLTEIQEARLRLDTDMADRLGQIRELIVKAEDSRMNDLKEAPKHYNQLNNVNKELINGYNIRLSNYNEGLETIKNINSIIQKASRLRVGQKSSAMISCCRTAIKTNNVDGLIKIMRTGML